MSVKDGGQDHRKPCTLCSEPRDVLVRCQIDSSGVWHFVCPGKCWKAVSGGMIDGDKSVEHEWYRYGGMWKNKHEAVSAKKPKHHKKNKSSQDKQVDADSGCQLARGNVHALNSWDASDQHYVKNDKVEYEGHVWVCRKSHTSDERWTPSKAYSLWKDMPMPNDTPG